MSSKIRLIAITGICIGLAYFLGSFLASHNAVKELPQAETGAAIRTNGTGAFPLINPLTDCIRQKNLRLEELHSFRMKIEERINSYCQAHASTKVSYYFRDLNTGMWIGINEKELFTPASLMKVPTMVAILKEAQVDPQLLQRKIPFHASEYASLDEEAGFPKNDGQYYSIDELLKQSIEYSDNAATVMLMRAVGMKKVIQVEDDFNLHVASDYNNQTNFVSVKIYADVFRILYNTAYLNEEMSQKALTYLAQSKFMEGMRSSVPEYLKIARKYGARDILFDNGKLVTFQLHEFGIIYYPGKPILLGIMTSGQNAKEEKLELIRALTKITYNELDKQMASVKHDRNKKYLQSM